MKTTERSRYWFNDCNLRTIARVFAAMTFGAINVGRATSQLPDYIKAKIAAAHIKALLQMESSIDPNSPYGHKPVSDVT